MIINLLWITVLVVFLIDLSGIVDSIKPVLWKWLYKGLPYNPEWRIKPWDCSLCSTWWLGIIYLLCTGLFTWFNLMLVGLLAFFTPVIKDLLIVVKELIIKVLNKI